VKSLRLSADLSLPLEAVTEKLGFLGRTGGGKSYAAQKLAEEMHAAGAQFVALDPVGIWWGLRLAKNGKDAGIAIPVLGGLRGDVPLEPSAGKVIADLVVDKGTSVVIDVSQFESDADKTRFATDFAARFFFRKKASPSPVHVFIEEAQEFVPQNTMKGEERMLHAFHRMIKLGRNFGIGASLISQRPQEVNKKVLNQTELLFVFQLTGPQERKVVEGWIREKGIDEDIAGELPKLKRGHPHAWSPAWLQISRVVAIGEKWTFDASSTPKIGAGQNVRELAPIDIEKLGAEIQKSAERAKAEDPKELRRQLADRDRQIRQLQAGKPAERVVEKPVVDQAAIDRAVEKALSTMRTRIKGEATHVRRSLARINLVANEIVELIDPAIARLDIAFIEANGLPSLSRNGSGAVAQSARAPLQSEMRVRIPPAPSGSRTSIGRDGHNGDAGSSPVRRLDDAGISGVQQRILDTLQGLSSLGIDEPDKATAAALVGYHPNAKSYSNAIGALRTSGYIEYPSGGRIRLTDAGSAIAESRLSVASTDELHQVWFDKLGNVAKRILAPLLEAYPDPVEADVVAGNAGYHPNAKSFSNMKGRLRTLGLIHYPRPGMLAATDVLFPEGLS
jgi:uncharacterized protein